MRILAFGLMCILGSKGAFAWSGLPFEMDAQGSAGFSAELEKNLGAGIWLPAVSGGQVIRLYSADCNGYNCSLLYFIDNENHARQYSIATSAAVANFYAVVRATGAVSVGNRGEIRIEGVNCERASAASVVSCKGYDARRGSGETPTPDNPPIP